MKSGSLEKDFCLTYLIVFLFDSDARVHQDEDPLDNDSRGSSKQFIEMTAILQQKLQQEKIKLVLSFLMMTRANLSIIYFQKLNVKCFNQLLLNFTQIFFSLNRNHPRQFSSGKLYVFLWGF